MLMLFRKLFVRHLNIIQVLHWCDEIGIPEVTVYAFSIENFKRPPEEVDALLSIFQDKIKRLLDEKYL